MKPQTVPTDIYRLLDDSPAPEGAWVDDVLERMGAAMQQAVRDAIGHDQKREGRLRLSGMGKPNRQLWLGYNGYTGEKLAGNTRVKFLTGHILEAMLVALMELSGHDVTDLQSKAEVNGVKGSRDCRIDGILADIKTASSYGFKKFKEGSLKDDDPFGYIAQIKGYAHEKGDTKYGWLAIDKQHGHITWLEYDEKTDDLPLDIAERVAEVKDVIASDKMPERCYDPVPDGKSGNMKLPVGCSYCEFKKTCYPNLRTFLYSTGPRYLTDVVNEPKVTELLEDF